MRVKNLHGSAFLGAFYKTKKTSSVRAGLFLSPKFLLVENETGITRRLTSIRITKV